MSEIALIGFVQALFFALLIVTKRQAEKKDYLLAVFLLLVGAELFYRYMWLAGRAENNRWLALFDIVYWPLFGVLTLMYVNTTTGRVKEFRWRHLVHLVPLLIGLAAVIEFYFGDNQPVSFIAYFNASVGPRKIALWVWEYTSPVYLLYTFYILIKHKKSVKNCFTDIEQRDLKWLFLLISGFLIYIACSYIFQLVQLLFDFSTEFRFLQILPVILTVYVFVIGFFGYKQAGIFFQEPEILKSQENGRTKSDKYAKTGLSDDERMEIIQNLNVIMEMEKLFIECDLNIGDLARKLDTSIHKLSQVINESFDQNFYDYVNWYRIDEVKKLMRDPENRQYTIMSLAYDCGFSSKTAFYTAFRKNTGTTPGRYLQKEMLVSA